MELRGKNVILVGASSGIGRALAVELAREGARLFLAARRKELLEGGVSFACDTSDPAQVEAAFRHFAAIAPPDGLIYNAGISSLTMLDRYSSAETKRVLETNFYGFLYWLDHLLPLFRERREGFLAATTALCAYRGIPSGESYSASKGALGNFLESLRVDLAPQGIRVFQLMPGFVKTPMTDLNNITSPFLISAEKAARIVVDGMRRDRTHIEFSRGMSWAMRILRNFPDGWYSALFKNSWMLPRQNLERLLTRLPPFLCPEHGVPMAFDRYAHWRCPTCERRVSLLRDHLDLVDGTAEAEGAQDKKIKFAYRIYSFVYPILALCAMKFVWKGSLGHLLRFYRERIEAAAHDGEIFLDVATGDASLTKLVLKGVQGAPDFLSVDLSRDMLLKASKNLRRYPGKLFYLCDIGRLNVPDESFSHILCFGGIHVFSDPRGALEKMRRLLRPGGRLSGSYLMRPGTMWGNRLSDRLIENGFLSNSLTEPQFEELFASAGLRLVRKERNGAMMLFVAGR